MVLLGVRPRDLLAEPRKRAWVVDSEGANGAATTGVDDCKAAIGRPALDGSLVCEIGVADVLDAQAVLIAPEPGQRAWSGLLAEHRPRRRHPPSGRRLPVLG